MNLAWSCMHACMPCTSDLFARETGVCLPDTLANIVCSMGMFVKLSGPKQTFWPSGGVRLAAVSSHRVESPRQTNGPTNRGCGNLVLGQFCVIVISRERTLKLTIDKAQTTSHKPQVKKRHLPAESLSGSLDPGPSKVPRIFSEPGRL